MARTSNTVGTNLDVRHFLLLEDDPMLANLLKDQINELGYHVSVTSCVPAAIAALEVTRFDGGLLDLNIKGRDAFPVANEMKRVVSLGVV